MLCNPITDQICDPEAVHQILLANQCLLRPGQVEADLSMVLDLSLHDPLWIYIYKHIN